MKKESDKKACICEYISLGAASLHAAFYGIDVPLPKRKNPKCPVHGGIKVDAVIQNSEN